MGLKDAIATVLAAEGAPLHSTTISERVLAEELWHTDGKTPAATVAASLYSDIKRRGSASRFAQVGKNVFGLNPNFVPAPVAPTDIALVASPPPAGAVPAQAPVSAAHQPPGKKRLSFVDAAADVLARHGVGSPMHYRAITEILLAENLVKTSGKTPEATLYAQVITENARKEKRGRPVRFVLHGKGMVSLSEWLVPGVQHEIAKHNDDAESRMLAQLRELDPSDFEQLVGALLQAMGISDVVVTAYHGDKGIDATGVYELGQGLKVRVAVQAKRQKQNVQRPVVQALNGSLKPHQQGLIITTSDFGKGARDEAARDDKPLIWLINGQQLVKLLIANEIGARRIAVDLVEPTGFELGETEPPQQVGPGVST
jgi:restriction system protein